jgi:hypothetical protein
MAEPKHTLRDEQLMLAARAAVRGGAADAAPSLWSRSAAAHHTAAALKQQQEEEEGDDDQQARRQSAAGDSSRSSSGSSSAAELLEAKARTAGFLRKGTYLLAVPAVNLRMTTTAPYKLQGAAASAGGGGGDDGPGELLLRLELCTNTWAAAPIAEAPEVVELSVAELTLAHRAALAEDERGRKVAQARDQAHKSCALPSPAPPLYRNRLRMHCPPPPPPPLPALPGSISLTGTAPTGCVCPVCVCAGWNGGRSGGMQAAAQAGRRGRGGARA